MIRFISGFLLGYMAAKKPPSSDDIRAFGTDIQLFFMNCQNSEKTEQSG